MSRARPLVAPGLGFLAGAAAGLWPLPAPGWLGALLALAVLPRLAAAAFLAAGWMAAAAARSGVAPGAEPPPGAIGLTGRVVGAPEAFGDQVRFRLARAGGERLEVTAGPLEWPLAFGDAVLLEAALRPPPRRSTPAAATRPRSSPPRGYPGWPAPPARCPDRAPHPARLAGAAPRPLRRGLRALPPGARGGPGAGHRHRRSRRPRRPGPTTPSPAPAWPTSWPSPASTWWWWCSGWSLLRALLLRWDWLAARADPRAVAAAACLPWPFAYALATGADPPVVRAALAAAWRSAAPSSPRGGRPQRPRPGRPGPAGRRAGGRARPLLPALLRLGGRAGPLGRAAAARPPPSARAAPAPGGRGCSSRCSGLCRHAGRHARHRAGAGAPLPAAAGPRPPRQPGRHPDRLRAHRPRHRRGPLRPGPPALRRPLPPRRLAAGRRPAGGLRPGGGAALGDARGRLAGALGGPRPAPSSPSPRGALQGLARLAAVAGAAACLLLPAPLRAAAARARGGLEVLFVAVGQGDAALLRLPDGSAVLVDGGGSPGAGRIPVSGCWCRSSAISG